jgi:hypothetical protein
VVEAARTFAVVLRSGGTRWWPSTPSTQSPPSSRSRWEADRSTARSGDLGAFRIARAVVGPTALSTHLEQVAAGTWKPERRLVLVVLGRPGEEGHLFLDHFCAVTNVPVEEVSAFQRRTSALGRERPPLVQRPGWGNGEPVDPHCRRSLFRKNVES